MVILGAGVSAIVLTKDSFVITKIPKASVFFTIFSFYVVISGTLLKANPASVRIVFGVFTCMFVIMQYFFRESKSSRTDLILAVAWVLFIGGWIQAVIGVLQASGLAPKFAGYIVFDMADIAGNVMGNTGQRNHYGHYMTWSAIAGAYLFSRCRINGFVLILSAMFFSLLLAWSGGRLILAYALLMMLLCGLLYRRQPNDITMMKIVKAMAFFVICVAIAQIFIEQINYLLSFIGLDVHLKSGSERLMDAGFGLRRKIEWTKAWLIFSQHPWFGIGWDGYAAQGVWLEVYGGLPKVPESWLFTHCHNVVFQLLAETGVVGLIIFLLGLGACLAPYFLKRNANAGNLFLLNIAGVTLIHSLFEFPLWYMPFLTMLALVMTLSPTEAVLIDIGVKFKRVLCGGSVVVLLVVFVSGAFYFNFLTRSALPTSSVVENKNRLSKLIMLSYDPFWSDEANFALVRFLDPVEDKDNYKLPIYITLSNFRPTPIVLQNVAILHALAGHKSEAQEALKKFIAIYPDMTPSMCLMLNSYHATQVESLQMVANKACSTYQNAPGSLDDRRIATVMTVASPVTRKPLF